MQYLYLTISLHILYNIVVTNNLRQNRLLNVLLQLWRQTNNKKSALNKMPYVHIENCHSWRRMRICRRSLMWILICHLRPAAYPCKNEFQTKWPGCPSENWIRSSSSTCRPRDTDIDLKKVINFTIAWPVKSSFTNSKWWFSLC